MESDDPGPNITEPASAVAEPSDAASEAAPSGPPDPKALVERLIEAGEWPEPELIEQIIAAGEAALGPLLEFVRTYPDPEDYEREIVLYHAIGILGDSHAPATIPDLVEILRRYPEDSGQLAAEMLGGFGAVGFEPALELVRDPRMTGYRLNNAIDAALRATGSDRSLRARLADVLRPLLADALERTREEFKRRAAASKVDDGEQGEEPEGRDDDDRDERVTLEHEIADDLAGSSQQATPSHDTQLPEWSKGRELAPHEDLMFRIMDLASLADPKARGLIKTAFAEKLVNTFWVDKGSIDKSYREGGDPAYEREEWFEDYREQYQAHFGLLSEPHAPPRSPHEAPRPASVPIRPSAPPPPPQETIRKSGPKIGRNDPCWCGSGKKYKKCHMVTDG